MLIATRLGNQHRIGQDHVTLTSCRVTGLQGGYCSKVLDPLPLQLPMQLGAAPLYAPVLGNKPQEAGQCLDACCRRVCWKTVHASGALMPAVTKPIEPQHGVVPRLSPLVHGMLYKPSG